MTAKISKPSAAATASVGLLALASAMGIGRFALTPILPLMQQDAGLSLTVGGWLATGNYLGYLLGALICIALTPPPSAAIRWGLVLVGLTTLLMGLSDWQPLWLGLRFLSGTASAFVLAPCRPAENAAQLGLLSRWWEVLNLVQNQVHI